MALLSSSLRRIKKRGDEISSTSSSNEAQHAGLRIVILLQISEFDEYNSSSRGNTIVVKSGLKSLTKTPITSSSSSSSSFYTNNNSTASSFSSVNSSNNNSGGDYFKCFLTSCHLCKRPLSPDKDIYMYRGDQGFCSEECRSRQIMMDEMKEMEEKTIAKKKRLKENDNNENGAPKIIQGDCVGCETCSLLQDLRKRRHLRNTNKFRPPHHHHHPIISPPKRQPLLSFS